jgi:hypothetical protein
MLDLGMQTTEECVYPECEGGYGMCCDTSVWSAQNENSRLRFGAPDTALHDVNATSQFGEASRFGVMWRRS